MPSLLGLMGVAYGRGLPSDITIACGGEFFFVHKAILSSKSSVMATELSKITQHGGIYNIEDWSPTVMSHILDFIYKGTYDANKVPEKIYRGGGLTNAEDKTCELANRWIHHGLVKCAADHFGLGGLALLANVRLSSLLTSDWNAEAYCRLCQKTADKTKDIDYIVFLATRASTHVDELRATGYFARVPESSGLGPLTLWIAGGRQGPVTALVAVPGLNPQ